MGVTLPEFKHDYPEDVARIVRLAASLGVTISPRDAAAAWEEHSEKYAAGWLHLPLLDEDLIRELKWA